MLHSTRTRTRRGGRRDSGESGLSEGGNAAQRAAALQLIEAQTSSNNFGRAILAAAAA